MSVSNFSKMMQFSFKSFVALKTQRGVWFAMYRTINCIAVLCLSVAEGTEGEILIQSRKSVDVSIYLIIQFNPENGKCKKKNKHSNIADRQLTLVNNSGYFE